jgi:DNA polymerase-3 subunit gamma/tau
MATNPDTLEHINRPQDLDGLIGQDSTVKSLKSMMDRDKLPQVLCFHGHTGCGKTTTAKILGKMIGGRVIELNIGDLRGIDSSREIERSCRLGTFTSKGKIYVLNECHQATKDFWNNLLETLEFPPPNVYFVLCTTEPEKLLPAVKSRCKMLKFSALSSRDIERILERALEKEGISDFPKRHIRSIASNSNGSARQALVVLDSVIDMEEDEAIRDVITSSIGEDVESIELARAIMGKSTWPEVVEILKSLKDKGFEAEKVRISISGYLESVMKNRKKLPSQGLSFAATCFAESMMYGRHPALTVACCEALRALSQE